MSFWQWATRLASNVVFVIRRGHSHGRLALLSTYIRIEFKNFFLANLLGREITSESIFGYQVHFYKYDTFAILFEEVYLPDVYFFSPSSSEPTILDCGANIGLATLYFKKLFPNSRITAFEADPRTFEMLERNIQSNKLQNVKLINGALYDSKGTVAFYVSSEPGLLVHSTRSESLAHSQETVVKTALLSDHIDSQIDLLKMDIEGAEERVMSDLVQENKLPFVQQMILEYHHHITPSEDWLGKFLGMLENGSFGYQIRAPFQLPFRRHEFQGFLIYAYRN